MSRRYAVGALVSTLLSQGGMSSTRTDRRAPGALSLLLLVTGLAGGSALELERLDARTPATDTRLAGGGGSKGGGSKGGGSKGGGSKGGWFGSSRA